jgi:uncharacterized protein
MEHASSRLDTAPTTDRERIFALDVLRGIAVLGILLMNITAFGMPGGYSDPTNFGGADGVNLYTWIVTSVVFEGTMRGLFTILFGAGVVLYTSRLERAGVGLHSADLYFRRNIWLIIFGLVNAYVLLWNGDILFYYGVVALFLYVFRNLSARTLLRMAIPLLCVQSVAGTLLYMDFQQTQAQALQAQALVAEGRTITKDQQDTIDDYKEELGHQKLTPEKAAKTIKAIQGGYASAFGKESQWSFESETEYFYETGFWECLGMMLLGMALMKSGALTAQWSAASYWRMLAVGWTVGFAVNGLELASQLRSGFEVSTMMTAGYITYDLGRIPLTLGHLAFIMLLVKGRVFHRAMRVLAAAGQMALTNYLAQSVICLFLFTGAGLALYGQLERHQLYYVVFAIWAVQLAWSLWWLARFRFGPMEWLWRSLTRWERQPWRRAADAVVEPAPA